MPSPIPVIDLFAGPGGLGEGFSSLYTREDGFRHNPFRIALSAERDKAAHKTLRLRSFYRLLKAERRELGQYYAYLAGEANEPWDNTTKKFWDRAGEEALNLEVGSPEGTKILHDRVAEITKNRKHWVLIGGPPCQAYSVAGRVRNKGKEGYRPEEDTRHFLYEHYLELIKEFRPSVFVMENVKGILSSSVSGNKIFTRILEDLRADTGQQGRDAPKPYRIFSLAVPDCVYDGTASDTFDPHDFVVRSELFGVPQARHRVILVGVRGDLQCETFNALTRASTVTVKDAIGDLPALRSALSKNDSNEAWREAVIAQAKRVNAALPKRASTGEDDELIRSESGLQAIADGMLPHTSRGALRYGARMKKPSEFAKRLRDTQLGKLNIVLNHQTRSHMADDFSRYLFTAAFGKANGYSPKQRHFPEDLAPDHENWFEGGFADRFRVQLYDQPSTTVTCHISKDGHYYIHPDLKQCRSLTVREAARLQTFPDNYFFEGNRTEQYIQVGNAVPPLLAKQIAKKVFDVIKG